MIRDWFRWNAKERPFMLGLYCTICRERIDTQRRLSSADVETTMKLWHKYHGDCQNVGPEH